MTIRSKAVRAALRSAGITRGAHLVNFRSCVRLDFEPPGHEPPCYPQPAEWLAAHARLAKAGLDRCQEVLVAAGFCVERTSACLVVTYPKLPGLEGPALG